MEPTTANDISLALTVLLVRVNDSETFNSSPFGRPLVPLKVFEIFMRWHYDITIVTWAAHVALVSCVV